MDKLEIMKQKLVLLSQEEEVLKAKYAVMDVFDKQLAELRRQMIELEQDSKCPLHGKLAEDGKCDVCEGRGIWELDDETNS